MRSKIAKRIQEETPEEVRIFVRRYSEKQTGTHEPKNSYISSDMKEQIIHQLTSLEHTHGVHILYACESGSRAWGFASPDSDYDVRFIYLQPRNNYLSIHERRDVIELPVNEVLDVNGWDLRKALRLLLKSNAPLYEWLQSPIVYKEQSSFAEEMRALMPTYFSHRAGCHHYLSMARNTFENDLQEPKVKLKKYFYALRPALACRWILEKRAVPPMEFGQLRTLITDSRWQQTVDGLLERKKKAAEKELIEPISALQEWIAATLAECKEQADPLTAITRDTEQLDQLFRKYIEVV